MIHKERGVEKTGHTGKVKMAVNLSGEKSRTDSDKIVELHICLLSHKRLDRKVSAKNSYCPQSLSRGFVRMRVDLPLGIVRDEIKRQLDTASQLPQVFTFLRRVGDLLTLVSRMQEDMLKVKHFAPPYAPSPEIYILDVAECENFEGFQYPQKPVEVSPMPFLELPPLRRQNQPIHGHNLQSTYVTSPGDFYSWESRPKPCNKPQAYRPSEWEQSSTIGQSQMQANFDRKSHPEEFQRSLYSDRSVPRQNYGLAVPRQFGQQQTPSFDDQTRRDPIMNRGSKQGAQLQEDFTNTSNQDSYWSNQNYDCLRAPSMQTGPLQLQQSQNVNIPECLPEGSQSVRHFQAGAMAQQSVGLYDASVQQQNSPQDHYSPNTQLTGYQQSYNYNSPSDQSSAHPLRHENNIKKVQNSIMNDCNEQAFGNRIMPNSSIPPNNFPPPGVNPVPHNTLQEMLGKGAYAANSNSFQEGCHQNGNGNSYIGGLPHTDRNYGAQLVSHNSTNQQSVPGVTYNQQYHQQQQQQDFQTQQTNFQQQQSFQFQQQPCQQQYSLPLQKQPQPQAVTQQLQPRVQQQQVQLQGIQQLGQPQALQQQGQPQALQQQQQHQALQQQQQPQALQQQGQPQALQQQGQPQALQQQRQPQALQQQGQPQALQQQPHAFQLNAQAMQHQGQLQQQMQPPQSIHQQGELQAIQQQVQPKVVQPHVQPGNIQEQVQPGAIQQQVQPGTIQQHVQPGAIQQQIQPGAIQQQVQTGAIQQQVQPGAIQQQVQSGAIQPVTHQQSLLQYQQQSEQQIQMQQSPGLTQPLSDLHHQPIQQQKQQQPVQSQHSDEYEPNQMSNQQVLSQSHQQAQLQQKQQHQDQHMGTQQGQQGQNSLEQQQRLPQEVQHLKQEGQTTPQQQLIQHKLELKRIQKQTELNQSLFTEQDKQDYEQKQEQQNQSVAPQQNKGDNNIPSQDNGMLSLGNENLKTSSLDDTRKTSETRVRAKENANNFDSEGNSSKLIARKVGNTNSSINDNKLQGDGSTQGTVKDKSLVISDQTANIRNQKIKQPAKVNLKQRSEDKELEHLVAIAGLEDREQITTGEDTSIVESSSSKEENLFSILQDIKKECDSLERKNSKLDLLLAKLEELPNQKAGELWKKNYEEEKSRTLELQKSSFSLKRELKTLQESVEPRREAREAAKSRPTGRRSAPSDISSMKICIRKKQAVVNSKRADVNRFKLKLEQEKKVYSKVSGEVKQLRKKVSEHKMKLNKEATEKRRLIRSQHR